MSEKRWAGALAAAIALLLPAGVLAATSVDRPAGTTVASGSGVSAAELSRAGVAGEEADPLEEEPAPSTTTTTTRPRSTTTAGPTTTVRPASATTSPTQVTLPPGIPPPPLNSSPATIPNMVPASDWSGERDGVRARLRIDPPAPAPGQTVRFTIDYGSAEPCCTVMLDYGDGSGFAKDTGATCDNPPPRNPGNYSVTTTHTYAAGAHKLSLTIMTGKFCEPMTADGAPPLPFLHSVNVMGCVGVGPAGQAGCSPFPNYGPNDLIPPIMDPACQIRSDCTKASPPRVT